MHYQEQIGDYVLELKTPRSMWGVRMAGDESYIAEFNSKSQAKRAIGIYQKADKRRAA